MVLSWCCVKIQVAQVVQSGESFLRRMFELLTRKSRNSQWCRLNNGFQSDIMWWTTFSESWNGVSMMRGQTGINGGGGQHLDIRIGQSWLWSMEARFTGVVAAGVGPAGRLQDSLIKALGHWDSAAYTLYICTIHRCCKQWQTG